MYASDNSSAYDSRQSSCRMEQDDQSHFGDTEAIFAFFVNETQIICISPPQSQIGTVEFKVAPNGDDFAATSASFSYVRSIVLTKVQPSILTESDLIQNAAIKFRVFGANFINKRSLFFISIFRFF